MKNISKFKILVLGLTIAFNSFAACPEHFFNGVEPVIINENLKKDNYLLCYDDFSVSFSGLSKTPIWVAQHLTKQKIDQANTVDRIDEFKEDTNLPSSKRSTLRDYKGSGYDRGHMAPAADMSTYQAQQQSFLLSNMVPQAPQNNRKLWSGIERDVRNLVYKNKDVYVVSGPMFLSDQLTQIGKVLVPTHLFKAILVDGRWAAAYVTENNDNNVYKTVSVSELEGMSGISLFEVSQNIKSNLVKMPSPKMR